MFWLHVSLRLGPCKNPSKQSKCSEKYSFICGGELGQETEERPWNRFTISWDFSRKGYWEFSLDFSVKYENISESLYQLIFCLHNWEPKKWSASMNSAMKLRVFSHWWLYWVPTETLCLHSSLTNFINVCILAQQLLNRWHPMSCLRHPKTHNDGPKYNTS